MEINNNDNDNDKLFFTIYRNLFINKNIFKFLNNKNIKIGYFKYQDIVSCEWMIQNGYFQLLKYKVERGDYLIFNNNTKIYENLIVRDNIRTKYDKQHRLYELNKFSIFNYNKIVIEGNLNSNNFYNPLFKNYSNYFIENGNFNETEFISIEYDNFEALNSLITQNGNSNNYKFQFQTFYRAIEIGSFKCAFLIFQNLSKNILSSNSNLTKLWDLLIRDNDTTIQTSNKYQGSNSYGLLLNKRVDFIFNKCNLKLPFVSKLINNQFSNNIFDFLLFNQTLSNLIESIKTLILFKQFYKIKLNFKEIISKFKKIQLFENNCNDDDETLFYQIQDDVLNKPFTNIQLNTILYEFDLNSKENSNILKLYKWILPYLEFKSRNNYFLNSFLYLKIKCGGGEIELDHSTILLHQSLFGIYNFKQLIQDGLPLLNENQLTIFKYCKNERNLQIDYINNLIKDVNEYKSTKTNSDQSKVKSILNTIFQDLIKLNDLELVQLMLNYFKFEFEYTSYSFGKIIRNINSNEMFDLILNSSNIQIIPVNKFDTYSINGYSILKELILLNNIKLLKYYKLNYNLQFKENANNFKEFNFAEISKSTKQIDFQIVKFVYENIDDFKLYSNSTKHWYEGYTIPTLENFIELINTIPKEFKYFNNNCGNGYYNKNLNYFNYIYNERFQDIEKNRVILYYPNLQQSEYLKIKKRRQEQQQQLLGVSEGDGSSIIDYNKEYLEIIKDLLLDESVNSNDRYKYNNMFFVIDFEILENGNLEFLELLLNEWARNSGNSKVNNLLFHLFKSILISGRINVYKYMESNYPEILRLLFDKFGGTRPINLALSIVIEHGYLDLLNEILLNPFFENFKAFQSSSSTPKQFYIGPTSNNTFIFNHIFKQQ